MVTRPQTWPVAITREEALDDVSRLTGSFEILEDGPLVTELLGGAVPGDSRWGTADSRRQHRRNHAGAGGAPAADIQRR